MGRVIFSVDVSCERHPKQYIIWSTVVDAPVEVHKTRDNLVASLVLYGGSRFVSSGELESLMSRLDATGCSSYTRSIERLISLNRAGEDEKELTLEGIIRRYCLGEANIQSDYVPSVEEEE